MVNHRDERCAEWATKPMCVFLLFAVICPVIPKSGPVNLWTRKIVKTRMNPAFSAIAANFFDVNPQLSLYFALITPNIEIIAILILTRRTMSRLLCSQSDRGHAARRRGRFVTDESTRAGRLPAC
jgi:hypothetical protein